MSAKLWRSQEEEWTSNYYITWVKTGSQSVGDQMSWRQVAVEKASTQQSGPSGRRLSSCSWRKHAGMRNRSQRGWPLGPRLRYPRERERNAVMANRVGVNMLPFGSVSNPLSHTTLSIKWELYFFGELCRSSLLCRR